MAGRSQDALGLKYRGGGDAELFLKWRGRGLAALRVKTWLDGGESTEGGVAFLEGRIVWSKMLAEGKITGGFSGRAVTQICLSFSK